MCLGDYTYSINTYTRNAQVNHNNIPAACFTHPEIAMVGYTEEQAKKKAQDEGFTLGKSQGSFKANSKVRTRMYLLMRLCGIVRWRDFSKRKFKVHVPNLSCICTLHK
jgi:hypothetical protein